MNKNLLVEKSSNVRGAVRLTIFGTPYTLPWREARAFAAEIVGQTSLIAEAELRAETPEASR